jgi:hypothetical protein
MPSASNATGNWTPSSGFAAAAEAYLRIGQPTSRANSDRQERIPMERVAADSVGVRWQFCQRLSEVYVMKLAKLTAFTAVALLAGGVSMAAAQSSMSPGGSSGSSGSTGAAASQGQCWDSVSKTVKNKSGSAAGAHTPGGVTTGSAPSGQSTNTKGTGDASNRPASAANLPAC